MSRQYCTSFANNFSGFLDRYKENLYNFPEVVAVNITQKIKMALAYKGMSEAELARSMGTSPSAFNQRMKTGKFSSEDMDRIADALGGKYFFGFEFPDGTRI